MEVIDISMFDAILRSVNKESLVSVFLLLILSGPRARNTIVPQFPPNFLPLSDRDL